MAKGRTLEAHRGTEPGWEGKTYERVYEDDKTQSMQTCQPAVRHSRQETGSHPSHDFVAGECARHPQSASLCQGHIQRNRVDADLQKQQAVRTSKGHEALLELEVRLKVKLEMKTESDSESGNDNGSETETETEMKVELKLTLKLQANQL